MKIKLDNKMKNILLVCCIVCLMIGFFLGRWSTEVKENVRYVEGKTIQDTIINWKADTVYLPGELRYKYVYNSDTIHKDVSVVDRDATIKATVEDWNLVRDYKKTLFDNESGRLSVDLAVQYNELQRLSYSFTPIQKQTVIRKERVFVPFVSASVLDLDSFSFGGGFFYHSLGFRVEWAQNGLIFGVLYKF